MTEAEIEALEQPDTWEKAFSDSDRAALHLADALSGPDTHSLDEALVAELRGHFEEAELAELILVAGQANLNNRVGNASKQLLGP